ncbi:MAG: hypothetical protein ACREQE_02825, partial [Candidatus Binataceae bacterium]
MRVKACGELGGICLFTILTLLMLNANVSAAKPRHHPPHYQPTPSPTVAPSPVPSASPTVRLTPAVLIAGGTGTVSTPTGESPAVLDTAEIYDPVSGQFLPIRPMTAHRDRDTAVVLPHGQVMLLGGVDTVLVPLVSFPGPTMPWILHSTEIFDPADGRFEVAADMIT